MTQLPAGVTQLHKERKTFANAKVMIIKMENEKKASLINIAVITGKLMLITCTVAILLAVINLFTQPIIDKNESAAKNAAVMELFPQATEITPLSDSLTLEMPKDVSEVYAVYKAGALLGYCVDGQSMGFSDYVAMMVGVSAQNTVTGIRVLSISDTPGIGQNAAEQDYLDSYIELSYPVSFDFGNDVQHADAISGATYSSRAILNGVNTALEFCAALGTQQKDTTADPTHIDTENSAETETQPPVTETEQNTEMSEQ